jgi:hypothetical protein
MVNTSLKKLGLGISMACSRLWTNENVGDRIEVVQSGVTWVANQILPRDPINLPTNRLHPNDIKWV